MNRALRDSALFGSLAFGLGFLFGALREMVLVPWLGRTGALIEFLIVTIAVATLGILMSRRWPVGFAARLGRGIGGVVVLVVLESTLALGVLGQSAERYLAGYDILAGALFPYGLTVMALAPVVLRPPAG